MSDGDGATREKTNPRRGMRASLAYEPEHTDERDERVVARCAKLCAVRVCLELARVFGRPAPAR